MKDETYSIIIPVFNSTSSIEIIVSGIVYEFENIIKKHYEIILVDDNSSNPETQNVLEKLHKEYNEVKIIFLRKNSGQHAALLCGMVQSKGDYIITMDDDLQHSPELIKELIENKNHDVVYVKFKNFKSSRIKIIMSRVRNYISSKTFNNSNIYISSFAIYHREIIDVILQQYQICPMFGSLAFSITEDIINIHSDHQTRKSGKSGYTLKKLAKLFFNILFNYSPFMTRSILLAGFGLMLIVIMNYFLFGEIASLISIILIMIYLIPTTFIIAEYLRRILAALEKKPVYTIKEILEVKDDG